MNQRALRTLEYDKIIDRLTECASSPLGKEKCRALLPSTSLPEIQTAQAGTSAALSLLLKKGSLSFSGAGDIRPSILRLRVGSSLSTAELLQVSSLLDVAGRAKGYFQSNESQDGAPESVLAPYFDGLEPLSPISNEIRRCVLSEEEIADDASPALRRIRRSISLANGRIHDQLNSIVSSSATRPMLQDALVTMRNGRYCLPVKAEYKSQFEGMIHDQSSSGSTLFIEPMSVVRLNNDLRELSIQEVEEIARILADLSARLAEHADELEEDLRLLSELDFLFAKGGLSKKMRASEPIFSQGGYLEIKKGRHPLIDPKAVVPIDISLGKDFQLLVVTGPNTGGKTVSLKTVGLFALMGQAGLHIPAFDGSKLCVFEEIFADIGDEQSIEQSLSTFSSHMVNTVSILRQANARSLVLFDELGAGTDPTEGAALAIAILSYLRERGIWAMATTHYSELKIYALSTDGVENACCEFDVETLRPTYRLLIGVPGKSNAFAISRKLGLPDDIIEDAKSRIGSMDQSFEDVVSDLENARVSLEREREETDRLREEAARLRESLKEKNEKADAARDKILQRANEQAREILQEAKDYADESIRKYNKWAKDADAAKEMERERAGLREKLDSAGEKAAIKGKKPARSHKASDFKLGDAVRVLSLNLNGTVASLPNGKGDLFVQMGILRSQVNVRDLEPIDEPEITGPDGKRTGAGQIQMSKSQTVSTSINLIGKTVDEALPDLDKYLDDAYLSHLPQVTIIHGRGTGALRNAVWSHLKKLKFVKSYRPGNFDEGAQGVTVVEFQ